MKATKKQKANMRRYYQLNREKLLEYYRQNRLKDPDKYIQKSREQRKKHGEKYAQAKKEYYKKHKEEILMKQKEERKKFKQKFYARDKARKKIKIPNNTICVICNTNPATQREHRDYSKPLLVSFVCSSCNKQMGSGINAI